MLRLAAILSGTLLIAVQLDASIITREEALRIAFPGAQIRYNPIFLSEAQVKAISKTAGVQIPTALIARYDAISQGKILGRAYIDTHIVRTKKESVLVILDPDGKVRRVEVVAFLEPPEYLGPDRWYGQFQGRSLTPHLQIGGDIHPLTGASLTAKATTEAVRRVLAIDQAISSSEKKQ